MGRKPRLSKEKVLVALQRLTARNGGQPSIEELRRELGVVSIRTVFRYLQTLEDDGAIKRHPGTPGVKLLRPRAEGAQTRAVPLVGRVPVGALMLAEENIEGWVHLSKALASPASDKFFLLRVHGTSMNRAKVGGITIDDGDLILVRQQPVARNGDIIVGMVDGEATVKTLVKAPGYVILKPQSKNSSHRPIVVHRDFRVAGKVTHVFKKGFGLLRAIFDESETY